MYFNAEFPTDSVSAIIPVTKGCNTSFTVNQVAESDPGVTVPVNFASGDSVYISVVDRTLTVRIEATLHANVASFVIPADIADQVRTQWSTFQIVKTAADGLETPLVVGSFERYDGQP